MYWIESFEDVQFMMHFTKQHEFRTNEIPIKVNTNLVPVESSYPRKDCDDRNLKTIWI